LRKFSQTDKNFEKGLPMRVFLKAVVTGAVVGAGIALVEYLAYLVWTYGEFGLEEFGGGWQHRGFYGVPGLGALGGVLSGLIVWLARPKKRLPIFRLLWTRGLAGGVGLFLTLILVAGVHGYIHGITLGHTGAEPGFGGFLFAGLFAAVIGFVPVVLLGFSTGAIVALVIRQPVARRQTVELEGENHVSL
jgi:hypothetical protein